MVGVIADCDTAGLSAQPLTFGSRLPAKGIYFRYIDGLTMENVTLKSYRNDEREDFVLKHLQVKTQ